MAVASQFTRFVTTGAVGTALHYLILVTLVDFVSTPVAVATLAGFVAGAVTNYALARTFVFATKRAHSVALPRFIAIAVVGALLNTVIVQIVYGAGAHYLVAQICASAFVVVWNYVANRLWTFS